MSRTLGSIQTRITIQSQDRFEEIEYYRNYLKEKEAIQAKYPTKPWEYIVSAGRTSNEYCTPTKEWWDDWQLYKKEITDLLLQPDGNYQNFLWEIKDDRSEKETEIWLRGRYNTDGHKNRGKEDQ